MLVCGCALTKNTLTKDDFLPRSNSGSPHWIFGRPWDIKACQCLNRKIIWSCKCCKYYVSEKYDDVVLCKLYTCCLFAHVSNFVGTMDTSATIWKHWSCLISDTTKMRQVLEIKRHLNRADILVVRTSQTHGWHKTKKTKWSEKQYYMFFTLR